MAEIKRDQAEGLRRLLKREHMRVMTVVSGCHGTGNTSVVINVAAAVAARGQRVLVIDENYGPANVCGLLGMRPRYELKDVMQRECALEDALVEGPAGVCVLPAANGMRALPALRTMHEELLIDSFGRLDGRYDLVLIDSTCSETAAPGLFSRAVEDTIVVSSAAARAITASYALVKRMRSVRSGHRFYMVLNRVASDAMASVVATNFSAAANGYLATQLEYLGSVPSDERLKVAARGFQPVVHAHPEAPSALGFMRIADSLADASPARPGDGLDSLMQRLVVSRHRSNPIQASAGV